MEKETYCLCGQPYSVGQFMIECDCCREWFHGSCVDVKIYQSEDIDKYHCPKCSQTYGPSVLKIPTNEHRQDRYEVGAELRPPQAGAPAWVAALAARPLRPSRLAVQLYSPHQLTEQTVRDNGFTRPIFFSSSEGLGMTMPNASTFTPRSVLRYCGASMEVEVIDSRKQTSLRMPLSDLVDYTETPRDLRHGKVLNVLSLEISDTDMAGVVSPPAIVRQLDWAERVWPAAEQRPARPAVQKYCLISAAGSYTDFHVDFGGTSVWYHALSGRKIFYLVPPTSTNLALYQQWNTSNNQSERFFGDLAEWYGTVEVCAGQTLLIPTGWIHAVLTVQDSLVMGGNLLHTYAIELQLQINEIERRVDTPVAFRYPLFETMHWYAGAHLLALLRRHNEETQDEDYTVSESGVRPPAPALPPLLLRGVRILTTALKEWHALKATDPSKRDNVPKCINSAQLVRELSRELRQLERHKTTPAAHDKEYKQRQSPAKQPDRKRLLPPMKKSIKLTLPKPIMHMAQGDGDYREYYQDKDGYHDIKSYALEDKSYLESKLGLDGGGPEEISYSGYDETYVQHSSYVERHERKGGGSVLRIKLGSPSSSSREELAPPAYSLPPHSILKSHLTAPPPVHSPHPHQLWTISKKEQDERVLFTNESVTVPSGQDVTYGPGMYSAEEIPTDCHYSETAQQGEYRGDYPAYVAATELRPHVMTEHESAHYPLHQPPQYSHELPSYDAAVAGHYQPQHLHYAPPERTSPVKASPPQPVRRSERPVRRRQSNTYSYEDGDLYIDETPTRRRKHKQTFRSPVSNYRPAQRVAPANGIESLIQASVLAEDSGDTTEDAAVAGMLSMGERLAAGVPAVAPVGGPAGHRTFGLAHQDDGPPRRARRPPPPDEAADDAELIKEVHRDEEYVYPSLEMSSDEEETTGRSHRQHDARRDKDEAWSPRARLPRPSPRARGPPRAGVRREAVRKALQAAATHRARPQPVKRAPPPPKPRRPPPPPPPPVRVSAAPRPKKGMKTAKQRLGKILKIHKMIY